MPSENLIIDFPVVFHEIASVIGWAAAICLVKSLGGCNLRIAAGKGKSKQYEIIAEVIGHEAAQAIGKKFGNEILYIPKCDNVMRELRNVRIRADFDRLIRVMSAHRVGGILAKNYDISYRSIEKIVNSPMPEFSPSLSEFIHAELGIEDPSIKDK